MKTWQEILLGVFLGLIAAALILLIASPPRGEPVILSPIPTQSMIMVHVSGAVKKPGVVSIPRQSRVFNAVEAAGGFTEDAAIDSVNLALKVNDGEKINIPTIGDIATREALAGIVTALPPSKNKGVVIPTLNYPINLNSGTLEELQNLPNIGPAKAAEIIKYRNEYGPFKKIEDIQNVPGIGPSIFEKIKDLISVE